MKRDEFTRNHFSIVSYLNFLGELKVRNWGGSGRSGFPEREDQGDLLFRTARGHMSVRGATLRIVEKDGVREIDYNLPDGGRFATVRLSSDGRLAEFSVNSPDDHRSYRPIHDRGAFVRTIMKILSPDILSDEREWAVAQLDNPARQWTPSFPIVVGSFVYRLHRANFHDHFQIAAADNSTSGWRYPRRRR